MHAARILSCAAISANFLWSMNAQTEGYLLAQAELHIIDLGIHPMFREKGA